LSYLIPDSARSAIESLPKVDLHRHLEGSLRVESVHRIARRNHLALPDDLGALRAMIEFQDGGPRTPASFLARFAPLRQIYRSPQIIRRLAAEVIEDAAADGVRYLEMRFTPQALSQAGGFPLGEVMDWVMESAAAAAAVHQIEVNLIASVNRHEGPALAEQVAGLAADRRGRNLVGLGLAGDELHFPLSPYVPIFQEAAADGLGITVHAGEWSGADQVHQAIALLGARRIGHGLAVLEDPEVLNEALQRGVVFEVCLTSNWQSGVVDQIEEHPLPRMLDAGLQVTLSTDDPALSRIRLSDEYALAIGALGLSLETLKGLILAGASAAFLDARKKRRLESELVAALFEA
jgi:adenosine deaminase